MRFFMAPRRRERNRVPSSRTSRTRALLIVTGVAALLAAAIVPASRVSADLSGADGLLRISSGNVLTKGGWTVGLYGQYYQRMAPDAHSVRERYAEGKLSGRYGFLDFLEAFVVLPGQGTEWTFKTLPDRPEATQNHGGPGDISLGLKVKAPLQSEMFSLAAMFEGTLPSGKSDQIYMPGASSPTKLFTTDEANAYGRICATFNFTDVSVLSPLKVHLNAGYWLNRDKNTVRFPSYIFPIPGSLENKDVILGGLGLEFPSSRVTLFTELYTEQFIDGSGLASFREAPILVTPGARMALPFGIMATAALDLRLSSDDPSTAFDPESELPEWGFTLGLDFVPSLVMGDMDKDGIPDVSDLCPTDPEDFDGFEDADGCPDLDNDQDGIADAVDKCPNQAETKNGYMDADGCPDVAPRIQQTELDTDGDGIPDYRDKCPNEPETMNGFEDDDGCPDEAPRIQKVEPDTDGDGIPDARDKCPTLAEDFDGFQDGDGCPDIDNDLDGIPDAEDKCPNDPEDKDGVRDDDGCPEK